MFKKYIGLELTMIRYCEEDVLTTSGDVNYEDGVAVNGDELWPTDK